MVSSTRLSLVASVLLTTVIILCCCFVMVYDVIKEGHVTVDYFTGIAAVIGSASVLVGSAGLSKAFSEKWKKQDNYVDNERTENSDK